MDRHVVQVITLRKTQVCFGKRIVHPTRRQLLFPNTSCWKLNSFVPQMLPGTENDHGVAVSHTGRQTLTANDPLSDHLRNALIEIRASSVHKFGPSWGP